MHRERKMNGCNAFAVSKGLGDIHIGKTAVIGMLDRDAREIRTQGYPER